MFVSHGNVCYAGLLTLGGSTVTSYAPDTGLRETLTENKSAAVLKLRYEVLQLSLQGLSTNTSLTPTLTWLFYQCPNHPSMNRLCFSRNDVQVLVFIKFFYIDKLIEFYHAFVRK